jgi:hypothetical protein
MIGLVVRKANDSHMGKSDAGWTIEGYRGLKSPARKNTGEGNRGDFRPAFAVPRENMNVSRASGPCEAGS